MLENSVWRQYHDSRTIHDTLTTLYGCEDEMIETDETHLYATLKRRLTKKELRAFIMKEAGIKDDVISSELHVNAKELEVMLRKAYRKVRQDELRNAVSVSIKKLNNTDS